jgi:hypothetical protein
VYALKRAHIRAINPRCAKVSKPESFIGYLSKQFVRSYTNSIFLIITFRERKTVEREKSKSLKASPKILKCDVERFTVDTKTQYTATGTYRGNKGRVTCRDSMFRDGRQNALISCNVYWWNKIVNEIKRCLYTFLRGKHE